MNIYDQIKTMSDEMAGDLTAQRRDFHKYAEPGWFEMRTSSIIARKLTELGYEVLVGDQVCKKDSRMGVPSEEKLEEQYERAVAQGADPEFVKYTKGGRHINRISIDVAKCGCVDCFLFIHHVYLKSQNIHLEIIRDSKYAYKDTDCKECIQIPLF